MAHLLFHSLQLTRVLIFKTNSTWANNTELNQQEGNEYENIYYCGHNYQCNDKLTTCLKNFQSSADEKICNYLHLPMKRFARVNITIKILFFNHYDIMKTDSTRSVALRFVLF